MVFQSCFSKNLLPHAIHFAPAPIALRCPIRHFKQCQLLICGHVFAVTRDLRPIDTHLCYLLCFYIFSDDFLCLLGSLPLCLTCSSLCKKQKRRSPPLLGVNVVNATKCVCLVFGSNRVRRNERMQYTHRLFLLLF